jgi:predicted  nucleic acid-binding Zn-ribbon protein
MFLRAYQVLSKPSQDLIDLLGIEVPSAPALALHGIKADGIILNWKAPDLQKSSSIKYSLFVNGINVSELSPLETSIAVTDLKPGTNYIIRVVATNPLNFEAKSEPVHVQTRAATTQDFFRKRDGHDQNAEQEAAKNEAVPTVRSYKLLGDASVTIPAAPAMNREHSGSISQPRKSMGGRRVSAAAHSGHSSGAQDRDASEETVRELTAKLDKLNQEIEASKEDISKEDEEFLDQQGGLNSSKSELKQAVTDKEGASKALKKQVADLSGQNSSAQAKRQVAERRLQSKHDERQKLHDDIKKWEKEMVTFRADAEQYSEKKISSRAEADDELERLRKELAEETNTNKAMEDEVRQARSEVKELENQKDRMAEEGADEVHAPVAVRQGSDGDWIIRLQMLQMDYQRACQTLEQARNFANQAQARQMEWERRRAAEPHLFLSAPIVDFLPRRRDSNRRSRALSLRNTELNPHSSPFEMSSPPPYSAAVSSMSPGFASVSPFFNMNNGAPMVHDITTGMTQDQVDQLTGGGPTSPSIAGALLPSDLFDNGEPNRMNSFGSGSSRSSPLASHALPGLGAPQTLEHVHRDPQSPISNTSRSPSVFHSPRESSTNLPFAYTTDAMFDSDRRSIRSNTSSMRSPSIMVGNRSTKFAHIFGFNRQRGKTASEQGPSIGSLTNSESQSFPRQDLGEIGTANRRRGSHSGGGTWRDSLQNPFSKSTNKDPVSSSTETTAPRRRFGIFGPKTGDAPDSPRPGSTASSENHLPKPSADSSSRFGWGAPGEPFGPRNIGAEWGLAAASSWSRHPSRRPSIHGSTHNFIMEDSFADQDTSLAPPRRRSPKLAPIGTRPASTISTNSMEKPKLNPAAPSFKIIETIFNREKKLAEQEGSGSSSDSKPDKPTTTSGKKSKKEPAKDKDRSESPATEPSSSSPYSHSAHDLSPLITTTTDARISKDGAPSISTFDTASEPRTSLERTSSRASEPLTPRETFMQKLSRKSSASMFNNLNFPGFGGVKLKKASQIASASNEFVGVTMDETDEEGNGGPTSKSVGGLSPMAGLSPVIGATSAGREARDAGKEKFSFRRSLTGRRKGEKAPSLQESITSGEAEMEGVETEDEGLGVT